jgi:hypothetical protein
MKVIWNVISTVDWCVVSIVGNIISPFLLVLSILLNIHTQHNFARWIVMHQLQVERDEVWRNASMLPGDYQPHR